MSRPTGRPNGRPLKYRSVKELQKSIDEYFTTSSLKSIGGLTLYLGFIDRKALLEYEARGEFSDAIRVAKQRIATYYEEQAQQVKNPSFQIFALKNFGWSDKQEVDLKHSGSIEGIIRLPTKKSVGDPVGLDPAPTSK